MLNYFQLYNNLLNLTQKNIIIEVCVVLHLYRRRYE